MAKNGNNFISKRTAQSVLKALFSPEDFKRLEYLRAVILCGLPGSGKSTVGRLLITCFGFERFSSDHIRVKELFKGQEHRLGKQHEVVMASRFMVYEELARRVGRALSQGKRVVVDGTHMDDKRLVVLGGILSQVPVEQVEFVVLKPPEWIMRRRLIKESNEGAKEWWSIYKYWRKYMKEGKASFPTEKTFPRIRQIQVRRYAIRTFDWVPEIKAILWDMDGTLYKNIPQLSKVLRNRAIRAFADAKKVSGKKGKSLFLKQYDKLGSTTRVLNSAKIDGKSFFERTWGQIEIENHLRLDKKLKIMFRSISHLKHYILTNSGKKDTMRKISALGLSEKNFEGILPAYETRYLKPDPRLFEWAARKIGKPRSAILAVGDRETADIMPAKKAGMRTCYVWGVSQDADVSLPEVYEVAGLFGKEL